MKLTRAQSYALRAVIHIAGAHKKSRTNNIIPSHQIAKERRIPPRFLLKVLKPLVDRQLLLSIKGPSGGYSLAKPANEMTVLEVIEAADGPISGSAPSAKDGDRDSPLSLRLDELCSQVAEQTRKQLNKIKISELVIRE